jgi:hypothetical protein
MRIWKVLPEAKKSMDSNFGSKNYGDKYEKSRQESQAFRELIEKLPAEERNAFILETMAKRKKNVSFLPLNFNSLF